MAERVQGGCLCGAVRFEARAPSRFCAHCHCGTCRRAHGAAFVTWLGLPTSGLTMLAGGDVLTRYRTETEATRSFCGRCGSTVFYEGPRWPGEVHVAMGCLDGVLDREPSAHAYVDHAAAWWRIDDDLPQYGGPNGTEPKGR